MTSFGDLFYEGGGICVFIVSTKIIIDSMKYLITFLLLSDKTFFRE